ncbi:hypothetical protein CANTEDRAFT_92156 [Yamadazyma tenuis ATCC 10573]|uniref:glucan endo-1,3-beta-D-glucosidase n=2 Tax=Candida tenuis TaxID=2315449 RepID=G3AYC4_CANTC|nr:uncharacterized protein CANTEDRAFT_92156 [Yamadazyma tenuis ATCC 10573]EGV65819.1 hypothetical protein CANTEDRAFT_92156 [Yamadazyma tenuis ATCC 10573]
MFQLIPLVLQATAIAAASASKANVLEFSNVGFSGTYKHVSALEDIYSDSCSCSLSDSTTSFSGSNAPLNEELSVHFRGPLTLSKFAYYVSDNFEVDSGDSEDWERLAYYEASSQTADNVTFLTKAGKNSSCLGVGLTYADSDGISKADSSTILEEGALLASNEEFVIFSNISCGDSGIDGDCGVYRSDTPAYHGFYGAIKMFLFEFTMPEETSLKKGSVSNWNMPAIWLLNSNIPRTSQYGTNVNCSCWRSGCGEFDVFEIMNYTSSQVGKLRSTIHDYQGTDDIETGIQVPGYFSRDYKGTMIGGVVFDGSGAVYSFISNSTTFNDTIPASSVKSLVSVSDEVATALSSVPVASSTASGSSSSSSSKDSSGAHISAFGAVATVIMTILQMLF